MQKAVKFKNRAQLDLSGALHVPNAGETIAYALFAHCFTCTKSIKAAVAISETLAQRGIATLRFDFTGLGASKGDFAESSFSTNINDLVDAAEFLKTEFQAPQLLIGHSLGGTAMLAASIHIESAKAVACIGSPSSPEHILHLLAEHLGELEDSGSAEVKLAGRPFKFKQNFVDDVRSHEIDYRSHPRQNRIHQRPSRSRSATSLWRTDTRGKNPKPGRLRTFQCSPPATMLKTSDAGTSPAQISRPSTDARKRPLETAVLDPSACQTCELPIQPAPRAKFPW